MIRAMTAARAALAVCVFVACGAAHAAKPTFKEKPWKGTGFGTSFVTADVVSIFFTGNVSHLGRIEADGEHVWDGDGFSGAGTMIGANKHEIEILYQADREGTALPFTFRGTITVVGGTGRWARATGSAVLVGIDDGTGVFSFELDGTLTFLTED